MHDMVFGEKCIGGLAKIIYRSMSTIVYRRVVHKTIYRSMSTIIYQRVVHKTIYRSMSTIYIGGLFTNKTNTFVLKTMLHVWKIACVRESMMI